MKNKRQERIIISGCEERIYEGNEIGCLLIHGFKSCPFEMEGMGEYLNKQGYTVHIILLPGHGTVPQDLKNVRWYDWFDKAKSSLFELRKTCKKVFVAGLSTGGSLALHLAAHYQVDGIIALAPGLFLKRKSAKLSHVLKFFWQYTKDHKGPDISIKTETKSYQYIPIKAVSELLKLFKHLQQDLKDIYTPTLIIYSIMDHVINPKSSLTIYDNISSKNKQILKLEKSYHIITLDVEKEIVFSEANSFIKRLINS